MSVTVSGAFQDPDGDDLSFAVSSSVPQVAAASVSGSTLTVAPLKAGQTTVTVTATDEDGSNRAATQRFEVTVVNRAPEAVGTLAALTLRVEDGEEVVQVAGAFSDEDGDVLTYDTESSNPLVGDRPGIGISGDRDAAVGGIDDGDGDGHRRGGHEHPGDAVLRRHGPGPKRCDRGSSEPHVD